MAEIKSNYVVDAINTAKKYLSDPHCVSLVTMAMIDERNKNLDIDFYVYDDVSIELYRDAILTTLLRCEASKILFRSCQISSKFVTDYQKTSDLTDNTRPPSSSDEFLLNSKVILDLIIEDDKTIFKCYRVNEIQSRTITIRVKEPEIIEVLEIASSE